MYVKAYWFLEWVEHAIARESYNSFAIFARIAHVWAKSCQNEESREEMNNKTNADTCIFQVQTHIHDTNLCLSLPLPDRIVCVRIYDKQRQNDTAREKR